MKVVDVQGGIPVVLSNKESEVAEKCKVGIRKESLNEREQYIAKGLTSKGVLVRMRDDQGIIYRYNTQNPGDYYGW